MNLRLLVLPAARDDIAAAAASYSAERPDLGLTFLESIDELFRRIVENPRQFSMIQPAVRRGLTHRFPYGVYFTASEQRVIILAVIHLHRHPESWKRGR